MNKIMKIIFNTTADATGNRIKNAYTLKKDLTGNDVDVLCGLRVAAYLHTSHSRRHIVPDNWLPLAAKAPDMALIGYRETRKRTTKLAARLHGLLVQRRYASAMSAQQWQNESIRRRMLDSTHKELRDLQRHGDLPKDQSFGPLSYDAGTAHAIYSALIKHILAQYKRSVSNCRELQFVLGERAQLPA